MSDKKLTVDDILAEFDQKETAADSPDENITEEVSTVQPVLEGVAPTESFSESKLADENVFSENISEEEETVEVLDPDIPDWNDIVPEIEENTTDITDILDDYEEIMEEPVTEDDEIGRDAEEISDEIIEDDESEEAEENPEPENEPSTNEDKPVTPEVQTEKSTNKEEKRNPLSSILPWKGDSVFEMIRKIIFIVAVMVFIGAGIMLVSTLVQSNKAVKDLEEIKGVVTTTAKTTIDSEGNIVTIAPTKEEEEQHNIDIMSYYKNISDKVVGFIELEGCDLYQPVVQDPENNEYYLTHTYYDEQNKGGAIFMDYRCTISEDHVSPNIVLYGHNQEDGTMFGNLKNYKQNLDFYAENPTVTLRTEYETGTYLIYAFFVTNALEKQDSEGVVFHYHDYIEALSDESTFDWYMNEVQSRNQIISPVDVEFGDKLLVLSTCSNEFSNSRFVVFARKLRADESLSDYDFTETRFNPNARGVDWTAIMSGETTTTEETTIPEDESNGGMIKLTRKTTVNEDEETTKKKKKKTTAESTEETTSEETTKKKKKTTAESTEETTKKKKKTTAESTEETTSNSSEAEETSVTSVPEGDEELTTTETAGSTN